MRVTLEDCIDEVFDLLAFLAWLSPLAEIFGRKMSLCNFLFWSSRAIIKEIKEHSGKGIAYQHHWSLKLYKESISLIRQSLFFILVFKCDRSCCWCIVYSIVDLYYIGIFVVIVFLCWDICMLIEKSSVFEYFCQFL